MDRMIRRMQRQAVGQPECARLLVALGRAGRRPEGVRVRLPYWGSWLVVQAIYPLRDGSGWACLFKGGTGARAEEVAAVVVDGSDA